jgi:hypothetical protein
MSKNKIALAILNNDRPDLNQGSVMLLMEVEQAPSRPETRNIVMLCLFAEARPCFG